MMTDHPEPSSELPPAAPASRRKRRWFRWLSQFSLRTLLVVMTAAAVGCWWFLQPESHDEELAGKLLRLRRQVRTVQADPMFIGSRPAVGTPPATRLMNDGVWRILDEHGGVLVDGQFAKDVEHGEWITYHPNGRKAVAGTVRGGVRTGLWQVWDENGQLRSETTYQPIPRERNSWGRPSSERHGQARAWHASGKLRLEGNYAQDRRDGAWTYYDASGQVLEQGRYETDRREGPWLVRDPQSGKETTVEYVGGLTKEAHERLLARLAADLASGDIRRQTAAADRLEELGPRGAVVLLKALDGATGAVQLLAIRALVRQQQFPPKALPQANALAAHTDSRLARWGLLALYLHAPEHRKRVRERLLAVIDGETSHVAKIEALSLLCNLGDDQQQEFFLRLVEYLAIDQVESAFHTPISVNIPYADVDPVLSLRVDLVPLLETAFDSPDVRVRLFVVNAVGRIVERGPLDSPRWVGGAMTSQQQGWDIPAAWQPLVERAKADPDEGVRNVAKQIGVLKGFGFSGMGSFF